MVTIKVMKLLKTTIAGVEKGLTASASINAISDDMWSAMVPEAEETTGSEANANNQDEIVVQQPQAVFSERAMH